MPTTPIAQWQEVVQRDPIDDAARDKMANRETSANCQSEHRTERSCAALLVSSPATGQGKTTIAAGLARLHARAGNIVRVFKCGQDFLDPVWLSLASGAPVQQLDTWLIGEAQCRRFLWEAARDADLIIVEGVMGLFDGQPSSADLAQTFALPVLAVIDAWPMAESFGAIALGLRTYRPALRWCGVLANRVAGVAHAQMLAGSLRESDTWLGAIAHDSLLGIPQRHLGLVAAADLDNPMERLDRAADAIAATSLGATSLADLARWQVRFPAPAAPAAPDASARLLAGCTIAIARDAAFCFLYDANLLALEALGAKLVFMSPLVDSYLPECDAVWLPGGYPELHADVLAKNTRFRDSLREHAARGKPLWAECGGMMCLFDSLVTLDGVAHPMWGLFAGRVIMQDRLMALGPQEMPLQHESLRGHTYHHSRCETALVPVAHTRAASSSASSGDFRGDSSGDSSGARGEAIYVAGNIRGSYFHAYFASSLPATARLFQPGVVV